MTPVCEIAVHLAVAGDVFDSVFLCCPFSRGDVLEELWDLIESVSKGFSTYPCQTYNSERVHWYITGYCAVLSRIRHDRDEVSAKTFSNFLLKLSHIRKGEK